MVALTSISIAYSIPDEGEPVEFRLRPGHELRVRVVDAKSHLVKDCAVWIKAEGFFCDPPVRGEDGAFAFSDLPEVTLTLIASVGGITYKHEHNPLQPEATIEVPVQGSIEVRISGPPLSDESHVQLVLRVAAGSAPDSTRTLRPTEKNDQSLRFGAVLPGEYEAWLETWVLPLDERPGRWERCGKSAVVVVRAEQTTQLELGQ